MGGKDRLDQGYKVIRVITVAPVLALIMLVIVAGSCEGIFPSAWHLAYDCGFPNGVESGIFQLVKVALSSVVALSGLIRSRQTAWLKAFGAWLPWSAFP